MPRTRRKPYPKLGVIVYRNKIYNTVDEAAAATGHSVSRISYYVYRKYKRVGR